MKERCFEVKCHVMRYCLPFLFLCLLSVFSCSAFSRKNKLTLDPEFSVNVAKPQENFPDEDKLPPSKKEVFKLYGPPDYVRLWWSKDGRIHRSLEVDNILRKRNSVMIVNHSWIYLDKNIECLFNNPTSYMEVPLNDKVRTVCMYGDPENVNIVSEKEPMSEIWYYYSQGLSLKFVNDKIASQQKFSPMGRIISK